MKAADIANALAILERIADIQPAELAVDGVLGTLRAKAFIATLPLKRALEDIELPAVNPLKNNCCDPSQC